MTDLCHRAEVEGFKKRRDFEEQFSLADARGCERFAPSPPRSNFFHFHAVFGKNLAKY